MQNSVNKQIIFISKGSHDVTLIKFLFKRLI